MFLSNFLIIGQQVMVLFILIAVGFICGKKGVINEKASKVMTDIVLYIVTPCVMVSAFQREFSTDTLIKVLIAALTALVILIASILLARLVFRTKEILPLQKELLGEDGWFFGSIFVAVFNIVVWTYGLFDMSGDKKQLSVKRLALNPGIIGAVAAILLFVFSVQLPPIILQPVTHLANLNTPVPMLIIGFYLSQADFKKAFSDKGAYLAGAFRLIVIPLAAAFAMVLLKLDRTMIIAFAIACSAPTAATTTMFSAKFDRDVDLSVSVVASTTILSLLTMPLIVSLVWSIC